MTQSLKHVSDLAAVEENTPTYLAIGIFDGVHRGHKQLLRGMVAEAQQNGVRPAVLTFYPHPSEVIRGRHGPFYLCTLDERVNLLSELGLELVITLPFDEELRRTSAADFVDGLCRYLNLDQLWGGHFSLGYNREGDLPYLRKMGDQRGFSVRPYEGMVQWDGHEVSSSRVRRALAGGDMVQVSGCLGRDYKVTGVVVPGDGRGRQLGVPTANLEVWQKLLLPANGVYAAYAWLDDRRHKAAINIGYRPTVNGHSLSVEAHLLDYEGDLYGRDLELEIVARIRDERKFPDLQALVTQIKADIDQVSTLLAP
ncbi:MAG: riboflavin biosynthesis protein RibF [Chloroflexota bacterium]|nr:MAG: riboflavin biosynthesis protein RibF [Chloroflexota bacterium]